MPGSSTGNKYYRINNFRKNHRITFIEFQDVEIDEEGIERETWKVVAERWAYVEHRTYREALRDGELVDKTTDIFRINFDYGFTPTSAMVIYYNGNIYNIEGVSNIREENDEIEIRAIRQVKSVGKIREGAVVENLRFH